MANTFLTKTFASDSNRKIWTWSAWIKRSGLGGTQTLMTQVDGWNGNGNAGFYIIGDQLTSYNFTASLNSGTSSYNRPSMFLRDVNGWYHIVVRLDTTQSTASDRCRWYVNGEQLTDFAYANYPSLNQDCNFNGGDPHGIGSHTAGANYFDGTMSYINFSDGYSYAPTVFGSTDSTTGEWTINTNPTFTLGTHGFTILKNGNTITDQSTNSNNWSLGGGTLTKTEDCPDNVFATINGLNSWGTAVLTNGNLTVEDTGTTAGRFFATIHMNKGKWYMEFNVDTHLNSYTAPSFLLAGTGAFQLAQIGFTSSGDGSFGMSSNGRVITDGAESAVVIPALVNNDKVQIAYDADAGKAWFGINGTYFNSGNPTTAANPYFTSTKLQNNDVVFVSIGYDGNKMSANFGNGYFGTTAVSSAGTNASDNGIFEYDVPTGFTALSTKGLNL